MPFPIRMYCLIGRQMRTFYKNELNREKRRQDAEKQEKAAKAARDANKRM